MATKLTDSQTVNATGNFNIAFAAEPLGGFSAQASLGTATSATVRLQVRVNGSNWLTAATFNLSTGGTTTDIAPVWPAYNAARWVVDAVSGGNVVLDALGVGV
jgi:hypothetical protein